MVRSNLLLPHWSNNYILNQQKIVLVFYSFLLLGNQKKHLYWVHLPKIQELVHQFHQLMMADDEYS